MRGMAADRDGYASEVQVKVGAQFTGDLRERLYEAGFEYVGTLQQHDTYYAPSDGRLVDRNLRVRECGGEMMVTVKEAASDAPVRAAQKVSFGPATDDEVAALRADHGMERQAAVVEKERKVFRSTTLPGVTVNVDDVKGLGQYVKVVVDADAVDREPDAVLDETLDALGLAAADRVDRTYAEMALLAAPTGPLGHLMKVFEQTADRLQGVMFGVSTGVITTLGFIIGLGVGLQSTEAVLASILIMAFADAFSDAAGLYAEKKLEYFADADVARRTAVHNFVAKAGTILLFAVPFFVLPLGKAVVAAAVLAVGILLGLSVEIAAVQHGSVPRTAAFHLGLFTGVALLSFAIAKLIPVFLAAAGVA